MGTDLNAPVSWEGGISTTISAGTIVSALLSDRMTLRFGAGKVTVVSVALTAFALFGFSIAPNYWMLLLFAIPYGLGAGGVDAALNNYVAIHYESRHMSWLHAMWGLGTLLGPYIMAYALGAGQGWSGIPVHLHPADSAYRGTGFQPATVEDTHRTRHRRDN